MWSITVIYRFVVPELYSLYDVLLYRILSIVELGTLAQQGRGFKLFSQDTHSKQQFLKPAACYSKKSHGQFMGEWV